MNHLKYVLGINVPRYIPSNVMQLSETCTKRTAKSLWRRHQSETSLSKSSQHLLCRTKKVYDFRTFYYSGQMKNEIQGTQQRNNTTTSLEQIFPMEPTCQSKTPTNGKYYFEKNSDSCLNISKEETPIKTVQVQATEEVTGSIVEKKPRSYAEMITSYNKVIYGSGSTGMLKDNLRSTVSNGVRRSPFSKASIVSLKVKSKDKGINAGLNAFSQDAMFSNEATAARYYYRCGSKNYVNAVNGSTNDLEKASLSYASMIEKYSNAMNVVPYSCGWSTNLVPKRSVSTKLNEIPMVHLDSKKTTSKITEIISNSGGENVSERLTEVKRTNLEAEEQVGWTTKVDDIIRDLKRITTKSAMIGTKSNDKWLLQSVNERALWLDRVVNAHRKKIRDRKLSTEKTINTGVENVQAQDLLSDNITEDTLNTTLSTSTENPNVPQQAPVFMAKEKPPNPIIDYIKRGPKSSSTSQQNTNQTPTVTSSSTKEPQIELRMTPSQNESIVSINVDQAAAKNPGSGTGEQLLVVISSNRSKTDKMDSNNLNVRSDFGSMQISISENTVPVKQIEFSINGKPVSELKSIVARADKLDVVSSMDKVEIRIPSKDRASVGNEQVKNVTNTTSTSKSVLNLQIAAKFNGLRFQQPRDAEVKRGNLPHIPSPVPPARPTTPPTPRTPPVPPKPPRTPNLFTSDSSAKGGVTLNPNISKSEVAKGERTKSEAVKIVEQHNAEAANISGIKESDIKEDAIQPKPMNTFSGVHSDASQTFKGGTPVSDMRDIPSTTKPNEAVFKKNINIPPSDRTRHPSMNNENTNQDRGTPENRAPSNAIPWWSSEDSFRKIRKKGNTPKNASELEDSVMPKSAKEAANLSSKSEHKLNADVIITEKQDPANIPKKIDMPADAGKEKKPAVEENVKSTDLPDPIINVVRFRSPQRWIPIKSKSSKSKLSTPRGVAGSGRVVKRTKYRVNSNIPGRKRNVAVKKDADSTISSARSPKIVKYVPVVPQRINVEKKSETKTPAAKIEDREKLVQKDNNLKVEWNTDPNKMEKPIQGVASSTGKANVQHSNTISKEENNLGGGANRSADVSAKSPSITSKFGMGSGKEEKRHGTDGAERNLSSKSVNKDQRIKEILKSMKPIEKRKDGTLIDYGVVVSSRKPMTGKVRQIPRIRMKTPGDMKESISRQEKIVEPEKVYSTKKQTLTEPKSVIEKPKIVDPEKISSVKKSVDTNDEAKFGMKKSEEVEWTKQSGNVGNLSKDQKPVITTKRDNLETKNIKTLLEKGPETNLSTTGQPLKSSNPAITEKAPVKNTLKTSSPQTINDSNIKPTNLNKPKEIFHGSTQLQNLIKNKLKNDVKSEEQKKTSAKGAILSSSSPSSKIEGKSTSKMDTLPLMGTIDRSTPKNSSTKADERDNSFLKESSSTRPSDTVNKTGVAPLEGTIDYRPLKDQDKLTKVATDNEEKKVHSNLANDRKGDFLTHKVTKKPPSNKGGGGENTGLNGPAGDSTGSSELSSQSKNLNTPVMCAKHNEKENDRSDESLGESYTLLSGHTERPEKTMLYSSWLQRFKDKFHNDKLL